MFSVFSNTCESDFYWNHFIVKKLAKKFSLTKESWVYEGVSLFPVNLKKFYFDFNENPYFDPKFYLFEQLKQNIVKSIFIFILFIFYFILFYFYFILLFIFIFFLFYFYFFILFFVYFIFHLFIFYFYFLKAFSISPQFEEHLKNNKNSFDSPKIFEMSDIQSIDHRIVKKNFFFFAFQTLFYFRNTWILFQIPKDFCTTQMLKKN